MKSWDFPTPDEAHLMVKSADASPALFDARVTTARCVPAIRAKVEQWRATGYAGATTPPADC